MLVAYRIEGLECSEFWSLRLSNGPVLKWLYANTKIFETGETFELGLGVLKTMLSDVQGQAPRDEVLKIQKDIEYALLKEENCIVYFIKAIPN